MELAEDAAAASSVEPATECILSSSLDVHCDRLRRSWPASLYDCRMRFARDVLRQRLRTWCSCAPPQYTAVVTRAARYATQRSPQRLRYRSRAARSPPKLSPQSLRRRRRRRTGVSATTAATVAATIAPCATRIKTVAETASAVVAATVAVTVASCIHRVTDKPTNCLKADRQTKRNVRKIY